MKHLVTGCLKRQLILVLVLSLVIFPGCGKTEQKQEVPVAETTATLAAEPAKQIREGIQTLLVACFDEYTPTGFQNGDLAEFLMLLIIDEKQETTMALQVNPDCLVSFTPMGATEPQQMPLSLVYTYGSGGSDSQLNGTTAISKLLGGVPIDHYMTFTKDAIPIVNDMLGGIEVTVTEDFAQAYPDFTAGETVSLQGDAARDFFFFRGEEDISKEAQMARQHQYMREMFIPFTAAAQNDDFLTRLMMQLGERFATDLTISQMVPMLELLGIYELEEQVITIPGTAQRSGDQIHFQADEKALAKLVAELFY